jgi:hypothetical protein
VVVQVAVVQAPLEAPAEQPPQLLARPHALDQPTGGADPPRGQVDGQRRAGVPGPERRPAAAQDRGGGRVVEAGGVDVALAGAAFALLDAEQAAVAADLQPGLSLGPLGREPLGGEAGQPRVDPVGGEAERAAHQPLDRGDRRGAAGLEMVAQAGEPLRERGGRRAARHRSRRVLDELVQQRHRVRRVVLEGITGLVPGGDRDADALEPAGEGGGGVVVGPGGNEHAHDGLGAVLPVGAGVQARCARGAEPVERAERRQVGLRVLRPRVVAADHAQHVAGDRVFAVVPVGLVRAEVRPDRELGRLLLRVPAGAVEVVDHRPQRVELAEHALPALGARLVLEED